MHSATISMSSRIASSEFVPERWRATEAGRGSFILCQEWRCRGSAISPFRLGSPLAAREDAVKVGRRSSLAAHSDVNRPHLDGGERDAMLRSVGRT